MGLKRDSKYLDKKVKANLYSCDEQNGMLIYDIYIPMIIK
jgi:hypothetical protein